MKTRAMNIFVAWRKNISYFWKYCKIITWRTPLAPTHQINNLGQGDSQLDDHRGLGISDRADGVVIVPHQIREKSPLVICLLIFWLIICGWRCRHDVVAVTNQCGGRILLHAVEWWLVCFGTMQPYSVGHDARISFRLCSDLFSFGEACRKHELWWGGKGPGSGSEVQKCFGWLSKAFSRNSIILLMTCHPFPDMAREVWSTTATEDFS